MKFLFHAASVVAAVSASATAAAVHSGHASVELVSASSTYDFDHPIQLALRIKVDAGWHTYWTNPGEGGMKPAVEFKVPEGWKVGVAWPVPIRFKTGDLPGFGYVGEILVPVTIATPEAPKGQGYVHGDKTIGVKASWLTCDEGACVPGDAALEITLKEGAPAPTADAAAITAAFENLPRWHYGLELGVKTEGKNLVLTLKAPEGVDPSKCEAFPVTPQVVDPAAKFVFAKSGDAWTATVAKSEYLEGEPVALDLVVTGGGLAKPAGVSWVKK